MKVVVVFVGLCSMVFVGVCTGNAVPAMTIEDLKSWMEDNQEHVTTDMFDMFQNMKDFISEKVEERLINMEGILQNVAQRQSMLQYCSHKLCQPHGKCYVPEETEEFACECEEFWHGPYCNESNPCHLSLFKAQFEEDYVPRWEEPRCDEEGYYDGMQYDGSASVCVTQQGELLHYSVSGLEIGDVMPCDCARDEFDALEHFAWQAPEYFNCTEQGGYY